VSVVRGQAGRRWAVVAGGVALLCALPAIDSALPVSVPPVSAVQLRTRILDSASLPYAGYAESNATFGLPSLNGFSDVTALLDGVTRMRVWQAAPDRWRVDVLSDAGEHDTYQTPQASYIWDSASQLLTEVLGRYPVRLPRAADLLPPPLAVRLLQEAGPRARVSGLAPRRVAGIAAAGLRITPGDPASTVAQIDIWAEPASGLPLRVDVFGRGGGRPALQTEFLQVASWHPVQSVLTPQRGPGTAFTQATAADLSGALGNLGPVLLPPILAGRARIAAPAGFAQVGLYGRGLATFAVLEINGAAGLSLIGGARYDGGTPLKVGHGTGVVVSTSVINAVLLHPSPTAGTFVLAGFVSRQVLTRAAEQLAGYPW
jgi:hypothetical protein